MLTVAYRVENDLVGLLIARFVEPFAEERQVTPNNIYSSVVQFWLDSADSRLSMDSLVSCVRRGGPDALDLRRTWSTHRTGSAAHRCSRPSSGYC